MRINIKKISAAIRYISVISVLFLYLHSCSAQQTIRVGAKHFNEGYILSEMLSQILENGGYKVERNFSLGGTKVCFDALNNNSIDVYPEYSGTITEEILKLDKPIPINNVNNKLKSEYKLEISEPFGFNNTYSLVISKEISEKYSLKKISDLQNHPEVKIAVSYEFLKRKDGWENLASVYGIKNKPVGIEHGLAYQALDEKKIELTDAYSTDGEINKYGLITLEDDKNFFPKYYAVSFYRTQLDSKIKDILNKLKGQITENEMQAMNSKVLYEKKSFGEVANEYLKSKNLINSDTKIVTNSIYPEILNKTLEHLKITFISLLIALVIAIPLGVFIYIFSSISKPVLYFVGLLQTVPSIALLAFMIPLFGIGVVPAIIALFLYALLPILRNTTIGLFSVDPLLKNVAKGMGLNTWQRLRYVEIPMAMPTILAGIKTAAVINIGTATLAAFIGAGGLGEFIVTGLALNSSDLILRGAIPAALLAILVEFIFDILEKIYVPKHLHQKLGK